MMFWWVFSLFLLVPILVHLFDFRRAKKLYFSSIKYISSLSSKTKSKSRLKYLLILGCRLLIFGSVLFVIWHLVFNEDTVRGGDIFVYYDNSVSAALDGEALEIEDAVRTIAGEETGDVYFLDNLAGRRIDLLEEQNFNYSYSARSLANVLQESYSQNASVNILLSDFQHLEVSSFSEILIDSMRNYQVVLSKNLNDYRNIFIDSLWLQSNADGLSELSVFVDFAKHNSPSGSVVLKLMQGAKQLSSVVKDLEELDIVEFDIPINSYGQFILQIDGDDVLYDNTFYFVREAKGKPVISILNNGRNKAIEEVFSKASFFNSSVLDIQHLDYERLGMSDLIIFNNFYELPSNLIEQFQERNFLIFPADSIDVQSYNALHGLVFSNEEKGRMEIDIVSGNSLMHGIFDENAKPGTMPRLKPVFDVQGSFEAIIKFRDNSPFLLSSEKNYFFNTALKESSGFESSAIFLPLLYQIAFSSADGLERSYYYPGQSIELDVQASDIPVKLVSEGFEVIPSFNSTGVRTTVQIPDNVDPGAYYLTQSGDTLRQIAVNIPKEESVMIAPSFEELELAFKDYNNVTVSKAIEESGNTVFATSDRVGLWKYALILVLLLIFTETMLHRFL